MKKGHAGSDSGWFIRGEGVQAEPWVWVQAPAVRDIRIMFVQKMMRMR